MAKRKDGEAKGKAVPMTYESARQPNLRHRLQREARRSDNGEVEVKKVVNNTEQEAK